MRHLLLLGALLVFAVAGCESTGDTDGGDPWAAFKKDLRGDNMQMRSNFGTSSDAAEPQAGSLKPSWF
jgi:hypothetical protein